MSRGTENPGGSSPGRRSVIGVVGASAPSPAHLEDALVLGELIAQAGWVVLTGGRPAGVMAAAARGAKRVPGGLTVGILPEGPGGAVADAIDLAIRTEMGHARNVINVLSSDVVVACGVESPGTASEVALALAAGRPVILLRASTAARAFFAELGSGEVVAVESPEEAIEAVRRRLGREHSS